jgi:D-amino peptidase
VLITGDRVACAEAAAILPGIHTAVVKEPVSRVAAHSLHPRAACAKIRAAAERAVSDATTIAAPDFGAAPVVELDLRTTDIAEAMTWVRGVERRAERTVAISGADPLAVFRSFAAAILLSRTVADLR